MPINSLDIHVYCRNTHSDKKDTDVLIQHLQVQEPQCKYNTLIYHAYKTTKYYPASQAMGAVSKRQKVKYCCITGIRRDFVKGSVCGCNSCTDKHYKAKHLCVCMRETRNNTPMVMPLYTRSSLPIDIRGRGIRNEAHAHIHFCVMHVS